ncbi:unnamed protein product [Protopolystoma xenopodis]|uniref:Uncharacterized protein n=1 Tax=Protopolystoma xenopodis TaxID=117903 RepID=A0A3S5BWY4_9PLAT|nr:unnamed protein product [Protopolystoma xenopodis]
MIKWCLLRPNQGSLAERMGPREVELKRVQCLLTHFSFVAHTTELTFVTGSAGQARTPLLARVALCAPVALWASRTPRPRPADLSLGTTGTPLTFFSDTGFWVLSRGRKPNKGGWGRRRGKTEGRRTS